MRKFFLYILFILLPNLYGQDTLILDLKKSIDYALENSNMIQLSKIEIKNAEETLKAAKGRLKTNAYMNFELPNYQNRIQSIPQSTGFDIYRTSGTERFSGALTVSQPLPTDGEISLISSAYHLKESFWNQGTSADTSIKRFSTSARIYFNQPLFTFNEIQFDLKQSKTRYNISLQRFEKQRLETIYNVTSQFYSLFKAYRTLSISREEVKQKEEAYSLAKQKFEAGLIPEVEALTMEVELAASKNSFLSAQGDLNEYIEYFKQQIGLPENQNVKIKTEFEIKKINIDSSEAVNTGIEKQTDLKEYEYNLILDQERIKQVDSRWKIKGEISAFYELSGISADDLEEESLNKLIESSLTDLENRPKNKGVTFKLTVPIWDWGVNKAETQSAKLDYLRTKEQYEYLKRTVKREIISSIQKVNEGLNRLDVLKKSSEIAEKSYQISLHRFENGDITSQELSIEQNRLTQAKTAYLNAYIDYQIAIADLSKKTMINYIENALNSQ